MLAVLRSFIRPRTPQPQYPPLPEPNGYDALERALESFDRESADEWLSSLQGKTALEVESGIHELLDVPGLRSALRLPAWTPHDQIDEGRFLVCGTHPADLPSAKRRKAAALLILLAQASREMGRCDEGLTLTVDISSTQKAITCPSLWPNIRDGIETT